MQNALRKGSKAQAVPCGHTGVSGTAARRPVVRPSSAKPLVCFATAELNGSSAASTPSTSKPAAPAPAKQAVAPALPKSIPSLNIVFVAAEVSPWSKTGGLGDVVGGLPIELAKRGHSVISIAPRYDQYSDAWDTAVTAEIDGQTVRYFHAFKKGVHRVFIDHPWFLAKVWGKTGSKLYGPKSGADFVDNHRRFALFNKAAVEATRLLPFGPGEDCTFVANDWHTALVPVLLKDVYQPRGEYTKAKAFFCIHNIAFQGRFFPDAFDGMGLPAASLERFAFMDGYKKVFTEETPLDEDDDVKEALGGMHKKINWMKAGILAADKVLTVSPNYASEISDNPERGVELDAFIRQVGGAEGVVNGMDIEEWAPSKDKFLDVKYDKDTVIEGKAAAKAALQAELGLPVDPSVPLFGYIGRLEEQKGSDILLQALSKITSGKEPVQVAILGTGKAKYETALKAANNKFPGVKGVAKFSTPLAHLITAGADFLLVPSRFEPCGLIQLHAMQYGTVPLVASTGGLVDTVKEGVTGFHMGLMDPDSLTQADVDALAATVDRAVQVFGTPQYPKMVKACIAQDLSWSKPATKWEAILTEVTTGDFTTNAAKKAAIVTPVQEPATASA